MDRKDIFMSGFKSKIGYSFTYKDLNEFEAIIDFYERQCKNQKDVIDKIDRILIQEQNPLTTKFNYDIVGLINKLQDILKGEE